MREWTYLATAPNQTVAEMWLDILIQAGIPAKMQPGDVVSFIGVTGQPVRVVVAKEKVDAARPLLAEWENDESIDSDDTEVGDEPGDSAKFQGR